MPQVERNHKNQDTENFLTRTVIFGIDSLLMTLREEEVEDGAILFLEGEADLAAVPLFQGAMREKAENRVPKVVVDFAEVTFVNTPIWAVVVEHYQAASKSGTRFALAGLQGRVAASFEIVRLGDFIPAYETAEAAVKALAAET